MCKHEWSKCRGTMKCIKCGRYLWENGRVTRDRQCILNQRNARKKAGEVNGKRVRLI